MYVSCILGVDIVRTPFVVEFLGYYLIMRSLPLSSPSQQGEENRHKAKGEEIAQRKFHQGK